MKKLIYVTGAGRGIGQSIAIRLSEEGYVVAGCSRTRKQLEDTKQLSNNKVRVAAVDVTDARRLDAGNRCSGDRRLLEVYSNTVRQLRLAHRGRIESRYHSTIGRTKCGTEYRSEQNQGRFRAKTNNKNAQWGLLQLFACN